MATNDITIGSHDIAPHLCTGDDLASVPKARNDLGYQAGFETGFAMGREAGLKEASTAAVAQLCAARNNGVSDAAQRRTASDHFLLGLPCRACGAYYGSDREICPACGALR